MAEDIKEKIDLREAFYIVPKSGGFQVRKVIIKDGTIHSDEAFSDPDAWDPVMNSLEHELSRKFQ